MLDINSKIIYGSNGVCRVAEIREESFGKKKGKYYILRPVNNEKSVIYMPADRPELLKKVRPILSKGEIYDLIKVLPEKETIWIDDERERTEKYKAILESGVREELVKIIKTLYMKKQELADCGKKLHICDEIIMQRAENMLYEEFAVVLDIKKEDVLPLIVSEIEKNE